MRLARTLLVVKELSRSRAFYEQLFRREAVPEEEGIVAFGSAFALREADSGGAGVELRFETEEFDSLSERFRSAGETIPAGSGEPAPWEAKRLRLRDPDGNPVEITESRECVLKRCLSAGMSAREVAGKTGCPLETVEACARKLQPFEIRHAIPEDVPALARIIADNFDHAMPEHSPEIRSYFKQRSTPEILAGQLVWKAAVLVAVGPEGVIATGGLANFGSSAEPKWSISDLFVSPKHHRCGIGRVLMQHLTRIAREKGITLLHVPSSRSAIEFYRKNGYTVDAEQPEEARQTEITWMTRLLQSDETRAGEQSC